MNKQYKKILDIVRKSGKLALDLQADLEVKEKEDGVDISTQADNRIEEILYKAVKEQFPEDGFWGEEKQELRKEREYTWYVDPIDGTKYFAADIPLWSISIARVEKGKKIPEFAAIGIPKEKKIIYAIKGEGTHINSEKITNKSKKSLSKLTLAFDFSPSKDKNLNTYVYKKLPKIMESFYRVRVFGCGTLSAAWTATGFFGVFIKYLQGKKQFNDVVAGLLIAQEAGLHVEFETLKNGLDRIVICHKSLKEEIHQILK